MIYAPWSSSLVRNYARWRRRLGWFSLGVERVETFHGNGLILQRH
jgi:hypothetical protein